MLGTHGLVNEDSAGVVTYGTEAGRRETLDASANFRADEQQEPIAPSHF